MRKQLSFQSASQIMSRQTGFTLIELMIVIAIIGIIAGIGYPSYIGYLQETRRSEAMVILSEVAGEQQRFFTENNRFASDLTEMGYPNVNKESENGFYSLSVTASGVNSFLLTAAPVVGSAQEGDTECGSFTINSVGVKGVAGATLTADDCW